MILLVSGATKTLRRFSGNPSFGYLKTPRGGNSIATIVAMNCLWGADNDAFGAWDQERFWRMLSAISKVDRSRFLWVVCPDVVANAQATVNRWIEWYPQLDHLGLPTAFVGQDGLGQVADQIPWDQMTALFLGGSTAWKLSVEAEYFAIEAKARGKWVHVGRVNTRKRLQHAIEIGADSVDGTCFSRWPDRYLPRAVAWLRELESQKHFLSHRPVDPTGDGGAPLWGAPIFTQPQLIEASS